MSISIVLWLACTMLAALVLIAICISPLLWKRRVIMSDVATAALLVGLIFLWSVPGSVGLLAVLSILQVFSILLSLRLRENRLHEMHLRHTTLASIGIISGFSGIFGLILIAISNGLVNDYSGVILIWISVSVSIVWGLMVLLRTTLDYRSLRIPESIKPLNRNEQPTVTLAIPARNETHALTESLQAAVNSTYHKLEILVLDDCSQDRTSQLVRAFAHDGVRFIQGTEPTGDWLGKTKALQALQDHARGEYIMFAGVDTKLSPHSVDKVISYMKLHNLDMVSVQPQRIDGLRMSTILQQLRYYWQVTLPRFSGRVPVATSVWCIKADRLASLGSFNSVRNRIIPESVFARALQHQDMYHFLISNHELGFYTAKKWSSQCETALRVLYPTFRRQPVFVLAGLVALSMLLIPYAVSLHAVIMQQFTLVSFASFYAIVTLNIGYAIYLRSVSPRVWISGLVTFPFLILQEIALLFLSMLSYEFGEVNWKGRNVCYPVIGRSE